MASGADDRHVSATTARRFVFSPDPLGSFLWRQFISTNTFKCDVRAVTGPPVLILVRLDFLTPSHTLIYFFIHLSVMARVVYRVEGVAARCSPADTR